ncbi:MAG: alkaline phosphatase family protein, partial [Propionibacterium sp.]|nr:alkaline phosphatase family protein [Propionibacterium sp.]
GYSFYEPTVDAVVNALSWDNGPESIDDFRQRPTLFRELEAAGRSSAAVTLARFADSALTQLAFDGTQLYPRLTEGEVDETVMLVEEALREHEVVYCYERLLDYTGHGCGVGSWQWLDQLGFVDDLVAALAELASDDVCVLVTGDHGMINVGEDHRIVIEEEPPLGGYTHVGGESRFRQIYTDDVPRLAAAWRAFLRDRAEVRTRDEAIAAGWFGPRVSATTRPRIGDIVVAMRGDWALMSTTAPGEFNLVGMHGSLTPGEMYVPLITVGGTR